MKTDADGVATYTYTRYAAGNDTVVAYATGDRSKFSTGYVFWGVDTILTVTEVTEGTTINNGANKTYKVTYKNPTSGQPQAGVTLNVSALENINITADKRQNVKINGVEVKQYSNGTAVEAAQITTDSKGEATFTVSGSNAEVTPVVFAASNEYHTGGAVKTYDYKYDPADLQTTAAKVKFAAIQADYTIELTRDGGEVAATGEENGRVYKVLVKDKAGNVAKNETVNVAFNEDLDRVISTNTKAGFVNPDTEKYYTGSQLKQISVKTNDKGEASFTIASEVVNDYATPIAWIDVNTSNAKDGTLDEGEPKTVASISHFQAPYLDGAAIKAYKTTGGKATDKFDAGEPAVFKAELVNQSGNVFTGGYTLGKVTYTVFNTGSEDVKVGNVTISPNRSETFTENYGGSLSVVSAENKNTSVKVVATGIAYKDGKDFAFTAKEATATFTNSKSVAAPYTGYVTVFNTADTGSNSNSLWFAGKNPIKYTGTNVKYFGANGNEIFGETAWEAYLTSLVGNDVQVSYSKDGDNTIFKVISVATGTTANKLSTYTAPPAANNAPTAKAVGNQTVAVGSTLTFTATELAQDIDTADTLKILAAYSGNAAIATPVVAGDQLSVSITPVTTGATTITAVVADNAGATTTVTFNLTATATVYVSAVSEGNPIQAYAAATPTKAKATLPTFTTVAVGGNLEITDETGTAYNVPVTAGQTAQQVSDAINSFATTYGVKVTSSVVDGKVEILSVGTGSSTTVSVDGDTTLELVSGTAFATANATIVAGSAGTATPAKYGVKVTNGVANGKEVDYTITIGSATVTVTVDATAGAKSVTDVVNALAGATLTGYTLTANGDVIEIVQSTPSATNEKLVIKAEEQ